MADVRKVARLLGGKKVLGRRIATEMEMHEVLDRGLPKEALRHFVDGRRWLAKEEVLRFVGAMATGKSRLKRGQSDRLFVLAEALVRAAKATGSIRAGERWLTGPSPYPEILPERPIDILRTPIGQALVDFALTEALQAPRKQEERTRMGGAVG